MRLSMIVPNLSVLSVNGTIHNCVGPDRTAVISICQEKGPIRLIDCGSPQLAPTLAYMLA
eukprot:5313752-Prymnesium_polylepis.1